MPNPISPKQIQLIHIAKAELGLSDEDYRALLLRRYPASFEGSCKELTFGEAHDLLEYFKSKGFKVRPRRRGRARRKPKLPPDITAMVSPQQSKKIEEMRKDVRWRFHDGYHRFLKARFGLERVKTAHEAMKVIEALKAMIARQQRAARVTV